MRICRFVDAAGGAGARVGYLDGELVVPVADVSVAIVSVVDIVVVDVSVMPASCDPGQWRARLRRRW